MKHLYVFILIALNSYLFQAQNVIIPDANFKNALVNTACVDTDEDGFLDSDVDINNDGEIQVSEAEAVLNLQVTFENISSLQGIEAFINLQVLKCYYNQLTTLDVSGLPNLNMLECDHNQLTTLNISSLSNLTKLRCHNNLLSSLDLSGLTNLIDLNCGENLLTALDASGLPNLDLLYCSNNELTTIEVSGLSSLTHLRCDGNFLSSIDLSGLTSLTIFMALSNQFTSLDLSVLPNLDILNCANNQLTILDESVLTNLTSLYCNDNLLTSLDVSGLPNLFYFDCSSNQLTTLFMKNGSTFSSVYSFNQNPNLEYVCVDDFELEDVLSRVEDYGYTNCVVNSYCSFVPGGEFFTIEGQNTYDNNTNGCDPADPPFPNAYYSITDGITEGGIISDINGSYSIAIQEGNYNITPIPYYPDYYSISPETIAVSFPTDGSIYNQDFCITPIEGKNDLQIYLIPISGARPGFDSTYEIVYRNVGTTTLSGNVTLSFEDDYLDFVSSSPATTSQIIDLLSWDYTNIEPFESRSIFVTMNINPPTHPTFPVNGGDVLGFDAFVYPITDDENIEDNSMDLKQDVNNSFDPNDITCLEGQEIFEGEVGKYVHYKIRFENTGSASAVNIVVKDVIDETKFDIISFTPLQGSHSYITRITNSNEIEFIFENIQLPFDDANNDGYVVFKIRTLPGLVIGDTFENTADIYFDFNFPIITNTYITEVVDENLSTEAYINERATIYPNPVKDILTIKGVSQISKISIYTLSGQLLIEHKGNTNTIDVSEFKDGIYFLTITTELGEINKKIVKSH